MHPRPLLSIIGLLLATLSVMMALPIAADLAAGSVDWKAFLVSSAITMFVGVPLTLAFRMPRFTLTLPQTFVLTTASWTVLTAFAALPFVLSSSDMDYADAYFEAMSGFTTTGATVMSDLNHTPPGLLFWRALLQWMGGIGIIVMAVAVLPMLRIAGMQLFRTESSDRSEKAFPRAAQVAMSIASVYFTLTIVWAILYWIAGMSQFDAVCHAMTTISTGGFGNSDISIAEFADPLVDYIAVFGMIAGSLPFTRYLAAINGNLRELWTDSQVRGFLAAVAAVVALVTGWLWLHLGVPLAESLRVASFNVVSVVTTTGYSNADYGTWGPMITSVMFFLIFVGGCTGSTTGGIKVFRFQVMFATARVQIARIVRPHGVFAALYNGRPIEESATNAVLGFYFMFFLCFAVTAMLMALHGYDLVTSLSAAAASIANVGPGLGSTVGPLGNYAGLDDTAKWILSAAMLLGRLELFTVLILFVPAFWRR